VGQVGRVGQVKKGARTSLSPSAARQVEGFIAKFDAAIAARARAARATLRKRYPTAFELVYDNYNALAMGFCSAERTSDCFVSVAVYAKGVNLYFYYGRSLADPHQLLQGGGRQGAFIRVDTVDVLDRPEVIELLDAAVRNGDTPLPATGRGRTVIKSISAKQRPRRSGGRHAVTARKVSTAPK
jgi:hypothetical protein